MFRRWIPLAVLVVVLIGCSKKKTEDTGGTGEPELTGTEYTLKFRAEQAGDKTVVIETADISVSVGKMTDSKKVVAKLEYTETIFDMPVGADRPTKVTRAYKVAEELEVGNPKRVLSYAGKTVLIEKKKGGYSITADGKPLPDEEVARFRESFEKPDKLKNGHMLPRKPVKVSESWSIDLDLAAGLAEGMPVPVNKEASKAAGKLSRVYTKNGEQWGVIDLNIDLKIEGERNGVILDGTVNIAGTLDMPIDASSTEGVVETRMKWQISSKGKGPDVDLTLDTTGVKSWTAVK